jgi:hypothetical protein
MSRIVGAFLLVLAFLLAGYGVYALVKEDLQGGADAAGAILLSLASIAAILGVLMFWIGRQRRI